MNSAEAFALDSILPFRAGECLVRPVVVGDFESFLAMQTDPASKGGWAIKSSRAELVSELRPDFTSRQDLAAIESPSGRFAGYITLTPVNDPADPYALDVAINAMWMFLRPEWQRRGYGLKIAQHVLAEAFKSIEAIHAQSKLADSQESSFLIRLGFRLLYKDLMGTAWWCIDRSEFFARRESDADRYKPSSTSKSHP